MTPLPASLAPLWEKTAAFHGHACPGLALGCRIAADVLTLFGRSASEDEELVCVAETESCAVDAIQAVAGCSLGKGNLLLRMRGKHVFSFFTRDTGKSARFHWHGDMTEGTGREEKMAWYLTAPARELYTLGKPAFLLPPKAVTSPSLPCAGCGEKVAESSIRLFQGRPFCLDCRPPFSRTAL